jgi:urease gamma subunit
MTIEQLTQTAKDLQTFVNGELAKIKTVDGFNLNSLKAVSGIIHDVIEIIDQTKLQFKDITNEQMQGLAVDAVYGMLTDLLKSRLGTVGKIAYTLLPNKVIRSLCTVIVDLIVHAIHSTKEKVIAAFTKNPTAVSAPAVAATIAATQAAAATIETASTVVAQPK